MNQTVESTSEQTETRVVVALDDASCGREALEAAARLAVELHAELRGLFVEDVDAVRAASLPFVMEITTSSATARPFDSHSVRRAQQQKAALVRRLLEHLVQQTHISNWSFSIKQGRVTQRALADATDSDVVILGPRGHSRAVDATTRETRRRRPQSVLVVYDGAPRACEALTTASVVAHHLKGQVNILVYAPNRTVGCRRHLEAVQWLAQHGRTAAAWATIVNNPSDILKAARGRSNYLALIARDCSLLADVSIQWLVENLDCPVALL